MLYLWGVCRHLSACVLMSIFLPVGRLKVAFRCLPQCFSTLFFETELSFHLELTDWLGWLANKLQGLLLVLEILAWVILSKHLMNWAVFLDRIIFWTFSRICIYIYIRWLRACLSFLRTQVHFPAPRGGSRLSAPPVPEDLMLASYLHTFQTHIWSIDIYASKHPYTQSEWLKRENVLVARFSLLLSNLGSGIFQGVAFAKANWEILNLRYFFS